MTGLKGFCTLFLSLLALSTSFTCRPSPQYRILSSKYYKRHNFNFEKKRRGSADLCSSVDGNGQVSRRRKPPNNRIALRWVVESVKNVVADERHAHAKVTNTERDDEKLFDGLHRILEAKSKKDAMEAEEMMLQLEIEKKYSFAIQERVMKIASMAGDIKLALKLLDSMLSTDTEDGRSRPYVPSYMAYTATLNRLRKWRKVDEMRIIMTKLSLACKLTGTNLSLVAFNTYLAALCDGAKNISARSSTLSQHRKLVEPKRTGGRIRMELLEEAIELLEPGNSIERFNVPKPDTMSFNTVLNAVGSLQNRTLVEDVYQSMKAQGIASDIYTYNAMLKAASSPTDRIPVIDAILGTPNIEIDRYTIELSLLPLAKQGRIGDILTLLRDFGFLNPPGKVASDAYSTFLLALIKGGEVDIARAIFDICILSPSLEQSDSTVIFLKKAREKHCDIQFQSMQSRPKPITRHFNALFEGYRSVSQRKFRLEESKSSLSPQDHCNILFNHMKAMNVAPDTYSVTLLMGLQNKPSEITNLWNSIMEETDMKLTPPIYHSMISAYGRAGDAASACQVFHQMVSTNGFSHSLNTWNIVLTALSKASAIHPSDTINIRGASAIMLNFEIDVHDPHPVTTGMLHNMTFTDIVDGLTPPAACKAILDFMNDAKSDLEIANKVLRPNSQSYCLVASALSHSNETNRHDAVDLYNSFLQNKLQVDGRMLNAIIRCFGDEIFEALDIWKNTFRKAALDSDNGPRGEARGVSEFNFKLTKRGKNLMAAYNGLLYVSGQAYRPDIALRLVYAMAKDGLEPSETSMNCYNAGARKKEPNKKKIRLHSQYENMLLVECTKYSHTDKRRSADKRVRIII